MADSNEIHRDLFTQCIGERVALIPGTEDAMDRSIGIGMRHKCRDSIVACNLPVTARAGYARCVCGTAVSRSGSDFRRFCLKTGVTSVTDVTENRPPGCGG